MSELESKAVKNLLAATFEELKEKYKLRKVKKYLDKLTENILENLELFKIPAQPKNSENTQSAENLVAYQVNLILDNSHLKETPVVIETSPTFTNLFGAIEKYNDGSGVWQSDFTNIKSGSMLRANGGFLVLNAMDAIQEPGVWKTLKRVLLYGKLEIQDLSSLYQVTTSTLKPEPIEIKCKVILIGTTILITCYQTMKTISIKFSK
ncbi:MAG: AAA family ATPase [Ignavibacteriales bacterium]|nr:AAA family ATPase [Ignavibacteriales bacterium]